MRSGGEAALSLRDEVVVERERERDSLRRFLFDSRDLERFLDLSLSLDLDRERLRFLPCLLLLECLDRDELRLRERPMLTTTASQVAVLKLCCFTRAYQFPPSFSCLTLRLQRLTVPQIGYFVDRDIN